MRFSLSRRLFGLNISLVRTKVPNNSLFRLEILKNGFSARSFSSSPGEDDKAASDSRTSLEDEIPSESSCGGSNAGNEDMNAFELSQQFNPPARFQKAFPKGLFGILQVWRFCHVV